MKRFFYFFPHCHFFPGSFLGCKTNHTLYLNYFAKFFLSHCLKNTKPCYNQLFHFLCLNISFELLSYREDFPNTIRLNRSKYYFPIVFSHYPVLNFAILNYLIYLIRCLVYLSSYCCETLIGTDSRDHFYFSSILSD